MRLGFSSIYSWRPHVEHLYYLARLAQQAGHQVAYLTCDADLPACYARELRPSRAARLSCAACRIGGLRSYAKEGVSSIGELCSGEGALPSAALEWSWSSASTLGRFESNSDFASAAFHEIAQRLEPATARAYAAARKWIERERLDAVFLFNGRMDATRGILEAAHDAGIHYVTVERTWFGDGIQLLPDENCLGLRSIDAMMDAWRDTPLSGEQALRAASHVASRFLQRNANEWRAYNRLATVTPWPGPGGCRRILLVPGSRNEVWGHPDWDSAWQAPTVAYDALIEHLGLQPQDLVLRCHPNWGENIGTVSGVLSERYFTDWAARRGIHVIGSTDVSSTLSLIEQADAVVVSGGSAALEAGILGKQVIALSPSMYQQAGFQSTVYNPEAMQQLGLLGDDSAAHVRKDVSARIAQQALRFCYTMVHRVSQYVEQVKCLTTTRYAYKEGADPERLVQLARSGKLQPDDPCAATDARGEGAILARIRERAWDSLTPPAGSTPATLRPLQRRWMYRPLGRLREALPRGDR